MCNLTCRLLRPDDLHPLTLLEVQCFDHPWTASMIEGELEDSASLACGLLSATSKTGPQHQSAMEVLVGYALFKVSPGVADLSRFAISPTLRRRGLGSILLRHSLRQLTRANVTEVFLEVRSTNRSAIALYLAHAFEQVGLRSGYYPDGTDALVLRR